MKITSLLIIFLITAFYSKAGQDEYSYRHIRSKYKEYTLADSQEIKNNPLSVQSFGYLGNFSPDSSCNSFLKYFIKNIDRFKNLRCLYFEGCDVDFSNSNFEKLKKIECIEINFCKINFKNFKNATIKSIFLKGNNNIDWSGFQWNDCKNLECVSIDTNIPNALFDCKSIRYLYLRNGKVIIPTEIGFMKKLKYLEVTNCVLDSLPISICLLKSLKHLDISNNNLKNLPASVGNLKKLMVLNISHNFIKDVPDTVLKRKKIIIILSGSCDDGDHAFSYNRIIDFYNKKNKKNKIIVNNY